MTISGTAQVGETLTASVEPAGATASYQWQSSTQEDSGYADISDANASSYMLTETESGKYIKVVATGTGNYTGTQTSAATGQVQAAATKAAARSRKVKK